MNAVGAASVYKLRGSIVVMAVVYGLLWFFIGNDVHHQSRGMREIVFWLTILSVGGAYVFGGIQLRCFGKEKAVSQHQSKNFQSVSTVFWLVVGLVVCVVLCALMTPFHSTDVFGYINRGWQQAAYHTNPYATTIVMIPGWHDDPMITDHWVHNPSPYGFVFLHIARWLCLPFYGNFPATVGLFKFSVGAVHLLITALLWFGLRERGRSVQMSMLYWYGFNPLILLHHVGNGHNDVWMGLFLVLAALLIQGQSSDGKWALLKWSAMLPMLMVATLVKYAALVTLPITALIMLIQKRWKALIIGVLLSIGVILISGAMYLPDWQHFIWVKLGGNASIFHASITALVWDTYKLASKLLTDLWPMLMENREGVKNALKLAFTGGYALVYVYLCWRVIRGVKEVHSFGQSLIKHPASGWALTMVLALGVFSSKFYPWYIGMYFPLVFLIPEASPLQKLRPLVIAVTLGQLLSFTVIGQSRFADVLLMLVLPVLLAWFHPTIQGVLSGQSAQVNSSQPPSL